jgi:methionyl-tRNA formyltransferase
MKLVFAGSPQLAADALAEVAKHHEVVLVLTMPDSPVGRKRVLTPTPVAMQADLLGLPVRKMRKFDDAVVQEIATVGAEVGIVVAFGALIPRVALDLFRWLNLHYSLLPNWRGASPLQHSILYSSGQGMTIFELDEGMDTGPILASEPMAYEPDQTSGELLPRLTQAGISRLLEVLEAMPAPRAQQGEATFAPKISRQDARLNFQDEADFNHRKVMAFNPEPMAWCEVSGEPMRVLRSKSLGSTNWDGLGGSEMSPGELELSQGRLLACCANGTRLELVEVQPAGKKPMAAVAWFRGQEPGVKLD